MKGLSTRTTVLLSAFSLLYCFILLTTSSPKSTLDPTRIRYSENYEEIAIPEDVLKQRNPLESHREGEYIEAKTLAQKVRILCMILTTPRGHRVKAEHVEATWGRRCNKLIFMSSMNDSSIGAVDIGAKEGSDVLWGKTKKAFKYVYDNFLNDYDWFYKGDDDTYVILENMRYMLSPYDPSFPIQFGSRFKKFSKQGFMSGGAGYVLSREALRKFIEEALPSPQMCKQNDTGREDVEIGKCLDSVGVLSGDSRDSFGRGRFFPYTPAIHLMGWVDDWYKDYVFYQPHTGLDCCSDTPVAFHFVSTDLMYTLEYLLYRARPYGIVHRDPFPAPLPPDKNSIPQPILEKETQH